MSLTHFKENLAIEYGLNLEKIKCYTLESDPTIKILLFGKDGWDGCYIGLLINSDFHVLGVGSLSFINEAVKALYVRLKCTIPDDRQSLVEREWTTFDDEQQESIKKKLNEIFNNK